MVYTVIPKYANNIQGLVYMGAAILIIIVGLRGLGTLASKIPIVPGFLLAGEKIDPNWVMIALFLEFSLLMVLAVVTFFTPEDSGGFEGHPHHAGGGSSDELMRIKQAMQELRGVAEEDIKSLNDYVEQINNVNRKLVQAKADFFKSLTDLKQLFK
jgi:hypothetical protein